VNFVRDCLEIFTARTHVLLLVENRPGRCHWLGASFQRPHGRQVYTEFSKGPVHYTLGDRVVLLGEGGKEWVAEIVKLMAHSRSGNMSMRCIWFHRPEELPPSVIAAARVKFMKNEVIASDQETEVWLDAVLDKARIVSTTQPIALSGSTFICRYRLNADTNTLTPYVPRITIDRD
jgi:hypothetical protein